MDTWVIAPFDFFFFLLRESFTYFYNLYIWFSLQNSDQSFSSVLSLFDTYTTLYTMKSKSQRSQMVCRVGFSFNKAQLLPLCTLPSSTYTHTAHTYHVLMSGERHVRFYFIIKEVTYFSLGSYNKICKGTWRGWCAVYFSSDFLGLTPSWATSLSLFTFTHWRRKWQPTPVSLPTRDRGAWWAAVCGVAQSWTRLKQLSSSSRRLRIII